jgi:hypothetical protein
MKTSLFQDMLRIGRTPNCIYTVYNCQREVEWMILVKMRPEELRDAVERNVPVIIAAGVGAMVGEGDAMRICPTLTFSAGFAWLGLTHSPTIHPAGSECP